MFVGITFCSYTCISITPINCYLSITSLRFVLIKLYGKNPFLCIQTLNYESYENNMLFSSFAIEEFNPALYRFSHLILSQIDTWLCKSRNSISLSSVIHIYKSPPRFPKSLNPLCTYNFSSNHHCLHIKKSPHQNILVHT